MKIHPPPMERYLLENPKFHLIDCNGGGEKQSIRQERFHVHDSMLISLVELFQLRVYFLVAARLDEKTKGK